jgi:hypothetical protein
MRKEKGRKKNGNSQRKTWLNKKETGKSKAGIKREKLSK